MLMLQQQDLIIMLKFLLQLGKKIFFKKKIKIRTVTFSYQVDAEPNYDFFRFQVDDIELLKVSQQLVWKEETFHLTRGFKKLSFLYTKDFSVSRGEDRAKVQYIKINGITDIGK
jgi:hypothetical protein